jgi:hypothetical protein
MDYEIEHNEVLEKYSLLLDSEIVSLIWFETVEDDGDYFRLKLEGETVCSLSKDKLPKDLIDQIKIIM